MSEEKVSVPSATAVDVTQGEKQGSKCCGFCCDFRRAVIVLSIIGLVLVALQLILVLAGLTAFTSIASVTDDEEIQDAATEGAFATGFLAIGSGISLFFFIIQLVAAVKFNALLLIICLCFDVISMGLTIWSYIADSLNATQMASGIIGTIITYIFFAFYPLGGLIMEIKAGTMSKETYPREAYSCCCSPKV